MIKRTKCHAYFMTLSKLEINKTIIDFMPYINNNSITHRKLIWTRANLLLQFVLCDYMTLI